MALTKSTAIANAQLDCYETVVGTSPTLKVRTGPPPATVADASTGTVLATCALPSDWMGAASARLKSKSGTWEDTAADASGKAAHFEIVSSGGAVGLRGIAAGPWIASRAYAIGDYATNDTGKLYRATAAGTSASSGGPTGTGGTITDGGVTWQYVQAAADMALDNEVFNAGQPFSVSAFSISN